MKTQGTKKNVFANILDTVPDEVIETLLKGESFRLERIVSDRHSTPQGTWYDQDQNEWVVVLKGSAGLLFDGDEEAVTLKSGDYLNIPAHKKHRVLWTDKAEKTIWLAIHYR
ncbi:MAG TPA: cupin domain-containing protein [Syntrophorhabdaceae bacterium]|nr:cupin domain-containing protein [Syntrophorhabdaceae bacterium]